jgi:hypothetical protein
MITNCYCILYDTLSENKLFQRKKVSLLNYCKNEYYAPLIDFSDSCVFVCVTMHSNKPMQIHSNSVSTLQIIDKLLNSTLFIWNPLSLR